MDEKWGPPRAVRACPKLTTAFPCRYNSGKILDGVLGPALLQPTASLSLNLFRVCVRVFVAVPSSLPPLFCLAAVLPGSKFDF